MIADLLEARRWSATELVERHPLTGAHPHKALVLRTLADTDPELTGQVTVARWAPGALPAERRSGRGEVVVREGWFDYAPPRPGRTAWWVNFADPDLFGFWATPLLAQDELQCLEIPTLPRVREAWLAEGLAASTVDGGRPRPFTIHGAPRQGSFSTDPGPRRPWGLYGNAFACAPADHVLDALTVLRPPEPVNVLAMAAPREQGGRYDAATVRHVLHTAVTGFAAARRATAAAGGDPDDVEVHTGWWGCGAFGGDRELMALLQLEAADLAGLARLVFHTGTPGSEGPLAAARDVRSRTRAVQDVEELVSALVARGYTWGLGNRT